MQAAKPNPTTAVPINKVITDKPIIKVPGCPPIPEVMTGVVTYVATFDRIPELDRQGRPKMFYSQRIHDKCYRRPHFDAGQFVEKWDDEGAKQGLLPLQDGLQGADDLQRVLDDALERGHVVPDRLGPRLHRLLRRRLLGQGLVLRPADDASASSASRPTPTRSASPPPAWSAPASRRTPRVTAIRRAADRTKTEADSSKRVEH